MEAGHQFAFRLGQVEGARFTLAVAQVKNTQKVMNVNGSWNRNQLVNQPRCMSPITVRSMVPATTTGTITDRPSGTS